MTKSSALGAVSPTETLRLATIRGSPSGPTGFAGSMSESHRDRDRNGSGGVTPAAAASEIRQ